MHWYKSSRQEAIFTINQGSVAGEKVSSLYIYINVILRIADLQISQFQPVQQRNLERLYIRVVGCSVGRLVATLV